MTPAAIQHLAGSDEILGEIIRRVGPCSLVPRRRRSPYEALVRAVTYQQLNGKAAQTILQRVRDLFPGKTFPSPRELANMPDHKLRNAGLSRAKTLAVKDIAEKALAGVVPDRRAISRMSDAEIIERLTEVRGVGVWTVEMLLIFTLGRMDVLPATDHGVRKGFALVYAKPDLPDPAELLAYGERWRPHRSTAAWYLWRSLELPR